MQLLPHGFPELQTRQHPLLDEGSRGAGVDVGGAAAPDVLGVLISPAAVAGTTAPRGGTVACPGSPNAHTPRLWSRASKAAARRASSWRNGKAR